ncbi:putative pentatricopeptide repeat-containing protein [Acorus calamus]|uniref:Pentatricopeptide repeat-containing protein n=1 Tax=Acorus calamus TaxID=4465 RepID=A0AAV9CHG2_ACOCL|nr:putative pentatricopeptide repeat-containing protein [Acorus calamus]
MESVTTVAGIHPNEFTFATVFTACVAPFGFDHGRQIHTQVVKNGFNTHKFVGSSLLDMYAKAGRIHEARKIFNSLPEHDVVTCTAIIAGYAQLGLDKEALEMFQKLFNQGLKSNSVTYASILTAIAGLANLDYGRQKAKKDKIEAPINDPTIGVAALAIIGEGAGAETSSTARAAEAKAVAMRTAKAIFFISISDLTEFRRIYSPKSAYYYFLLYLISSPVEEEEVEGIL